MTFVINDHIEKNGYKEMGNMFDTEPYNYIFNRRTAFLDGKFVRTDHKQL